MSQDATTVTVFSNVNNPLSNFTQTIAFSSIVLSNYNNPNIIHLYEYDNDLKTCPCLVK